MRCVPLMPAGSLKQDLPCQGKRAGIPSLQPLGFLILMGSTKCSGPKDGEKQEQTGFNPQTAILPGFFPGCVYPCPRFWGAVWLGVEWVRVSGHFPSLCLWHIPQAHYWWVDKAAILHPSELPTLHGPLSTVWSPAPVPVLDMLLFSV